MMSSPYLMKIYFDEKTKRCSLPKDFKELKELAQKSYTQLTEFFEIYYLDDEKDFILIENQFDYENALLFLGQSNHSTLKITIRNPNDKFDPRLIAKYLENSTLGSSIEFSRASRLDLKNSSQNQNPSTIKLEDLNLKFDFTPMKCDTCQRKFDNRTSHMKHSKHCMKVFGTKRMPFDSKKQRSIPALSQRDITLYEKLDTMNQKISTEMTNLNNVIKIWKKACNKLNSRITSKQGRPFKELFVEINKKECSNCHRQFNDISYLKHAKNCIRLTTKRMPFDSRKQRIINLEHAVWMRRKDMMESGQGKEMMEMGRSSRSTRWRRLSERFRMIMRISRMLYSKE